MRLSKEQQKDMLLDSFEVLRSRYLENYRPIAELIGKMFILDVDIALNMWEYILENNPECIASNNGYINDNVAYGIISLVIYEICDNAGSSEAAKALKTRAKLKERIFRMSANVDGNQARIIAEYINQKDFDAANEVIQMFFCNTNNLGKGCSMLAGDFLIDIIERINTDGLDENMTDFVYHWIQQIKDPNEKAKATVKFLDFM